MRNTNFNLLAAIGLAMIGNAHAVSMPTGIGETTPVNFRQKHRSKDANSGGNRMPRGAHKRAHRAAVKARRG